MAFVFLVTFLGIRGANLIFFFFFFFFMYLTKLNIFICLINILLTIRTSIFIIVSYQKVSLRCISSLKWIFVGKAVGWMLLWSLILAWIRYPRLWLWGSLTPRNLSYSSQILYPMKVRINYSNFTQINALEIKTLLLYSLNNSI